MDQAGRVTQDSDVIDAVDRALAILDCFSTDRPEMGISEISRELGMHKSTVYRSLASLEARGLILKNTVTRRYSVGPKVLKLASAYLSTIDMRDIARPAMEVLRARTRETVSLYIPAGDRCVCIERLESPLEVRRVVRIGDQASLHAGSSGKVILAFLSEQLRHDFLSRTPLVSFTDQTITDQSELIDQLEAIRSRGYATSLGERVAGVSSASAPVVNATGEAIAALTVSGPSARLNEDRVQQCALMVKQAAAEISKEMGFGLYAEARR